MQRELETVTARGAQAIAIGQGTAEEAARVCEQMGVAFPCLGDPEKASYRAYDLPRAGWREIVLDPIRDGSEAMQKGYRVSLRGSLMRHSDWFQLPGVAIVDRAGIVRYLHRARHSGDIPAPAVVIAALPE
jgi:peroxiredoxin